MDRARTKKLRVVAAAAICAAAAIFPAVGSAATISTTSLLDDSTANGNCTLREAIAAASTDAANDGCPRGNGVDTITLMPGTYELALGQLALDDPQNDLTTIVGDGDGSVIDGNSAQRIISASSPLTVGAMELTGGDSSAASGAKTGGAIDITDAAAPLIIFRSTISDSVATGAGGGAASLGDITVVGSTITGNSVGGPGASGGGVDAAENLSVNASTIVDNSAIGGAGDGLGGGFQLSGTLTLRASIVDGNTSDGAPAGRDCDRVGGGGASAGFNLLGTNCGLTLAGGDVTGQPHGLLALDDNGGPVQTRALGPTAAAVDTGPTGAACSGTDQRGMPRPQGTACDKGAYEYVACYELAVNNFGSDDPDLLVGTTDPDGMLALAGDDLVLGGDGDDRICAGDGADLVAAGPGVDKIDGGPGADTIDGGLAADRVDGGLGNDAITYETRSAAVSVILDALANDGEAGEGDLAGVEGAIGGAGADSLTGDGVPNGLVGGPGGDTIDGLEGSDSLLGGLDNDTINGAGGADVLGGGAGNDAVSGGDGADFIEGFAGLDGLRGGPGSDQITGGLDADAILGEDGSDALSGGLGNDSLSGGTGNDRIRGDAGSDTIRCGDGTDKVIADRLDQVARDCEKVSRS